MSLLTRIKKIERSLPGPPWDGEITMEDVKIAARRLGLRDYKFGGEVDRNGICQSFLLCTDDMSVLHKILTMKKAPWGNIDVEINFFDGDDDEESEEAQQEDSDEATDL